MRKCFACDKKLLKGQIARVDTRDDQIVEVGPKCYYKIVLAGEKGYQPQLGGPKLFEIKDAIQVKF
ncbi:hypothetical protein KW791_00430 [Candidatus Parcubacteria bacterium]|nr:hypothetical protein [Candidatus Parcubacteria bacterium]